MLSGQTTVLLFILLLSFSNVALGLQQEACSTIYKQQHVTILGKSIEVELFSPPGVGRYPAVLMIHGQAGLFSHPQNGHPALDNFGEHSLACHGFIAILPTLF